MLLSTRETLPDLSRRRKKTQRSKFIRGGGGSIFAICTPQNIGLELEVGNFLEFPPSGMRSLTRFVLGYNIWLWHETPLDIQGGFGGYNPHSGNILKGCYHAFTSPICVIICLATKRTNRFKERNLKKLIATSLLVIWRLS